MKSNDKMIPSIASFGAPDKSGILELVSGMQGDSLHSIGDA